MPKRLRLDQLLVGRGLFPSREQARRAILAGKVSVATRVADKPSELLDEQTAVAVKPARKYVGRGALKLESALEHFHIDLRGKTALDIGASTGGFTDCMLQCGSEKVYAVDVGYGQLDWKLRNDPRVVVFEKTNIRYLELEALPRAADLAVIDVSFISLKLVLPQAKKLLVPGAAIIALIKPQFEVGKGKVGKGGVVRSAAEHERVIGEITEAALAVGFAVHGVTESPLLGAAGNKEFL